MYIACNSEGLSRIILPGSFFPTQVTNTADAPAFLKAAAKQIREYCEGKRRVFNLPLSPQGTEFQLQVWKIIRSIPYGETMSYGEIGIRLGSKAKARAVGGAANANRLPLVIPCHRVIGEDGSLTGFASGVKLKEILLRLERENSTLL